jgi:DNA polymerase elongation subunit (family B)
MSEYRMSAFKPNHFKWMKPLYSLDAIEDFEDLESDELLEMIRRGEAGAEPVLVFYFASAKGIDVLKRILKYPQRLDTGGRYCKVEAQVVMSEISPKDKLLTQLGLTQRHVPVEERMAVCHCEWIEFEGEKVVDEDKLSTTENEYVVRTASVKTLPEKVSKNLNSHARVFSFDIECYTPNHNKFPDLWDPDCPIEAISCSMYSTDGTGLKTWSLVIGDCPPSQNPLNTVIRCKDEIDLIYKTCELIKDEDPEILTGFNLAFDIEYMDARLSANLVPWPEFGRLKNREVQIKVEKWDSSAYRNMKIAHFLGVHGRIVMDIYLEVKRNCRFPQYNLNWVSNHFLGTGKVPLGYKKMFALLEKHKLGNQKGKGSPEYEEGMKAIAKVVEYCDEDAALCLKLFSCLKMWVNAIESANIMCVNIYDLNTRGQQIRCYQMLYRECMKDGFFINTKEMVKVPFEGGKVQDPVPGIHPNSLTIDFNSLYPSIMQAHNVCYTTKVPEKLFNKIPKEACHVRIVDCREKQPEDEDGGRSEEEDEDELKDEKYIPKIKDAIPGVYEFRWLLAKFREGILPRMARRLCVKRKQVQAEMKEPGIDPFYKDTLDRRQNAYKVACNSIYGFTGSTKVPLREAAVAVTAWGRDYITQTSNFLKEKWNAFQVYGDTDSLMFTVPDYIKSSADCDEYIEIICKQVTDLFPPDIIMKPEYCGTMYSIKKKKYIIWIYKKNGLYDYKRGVDDVVNGMFGKIRQVVEEELGDEDLPEEFLKELKDVIREYVVNLGPTTQISDGILSSKVNKLIFEHFSLETGLEWSVVDMKVIDYIKKSVRGTLSARRDNCKWTATTYDTLLDYIMSGVDYRSAIGYVVERIRTMLEGGIPLKDFLVNKAINATYKIDNAAMKLFGDRMRALGKVIEAGERLDYLVVEGDKNAKLGEKMVLEDVYTESLTTQNPYKIDYLYYVEKTAAKQVNDILFISYEKDLLKRMNDVYYEERGRKTRIVAPITLIVKLLRAGKSLDDFLATL